ncbi:MAG: aminoacetone oxidase family FAD-binding enzyme [Pyrinomonadaceae bacterium]
MIYDAIIIGGGAAGLFCAFTAGRRGKRVLVLEHNAGVGRKILISGGGRCNFTNIHTRPENFISQNPHFCRSALSQYSPADFVALVQKHRIPYYEKKLGQLFCRENSRAIVNMLLAECGSARVDIRTNCKVTKVLKQDTFQVLTDNGDLQAKSVVVACGGLSFPKIGASDLGFKIARQFGLKIVETRPSLVAMVTEAKSNANLAGVSLDAQVTAGRHSFRENILFTHRGLSGPAILQVSNYWQKGEPVTIDLMPETDILELLNKHRGSNQSLSNFLSRFMPSEIY